MGLFPTVVCRKCKRKYSASLKQCPHCGAVREVQSSRAAAPSDSVQKGTAAAARKADSNMWQLAFGLILLAAVMLSVIVLITTGLNDRESAAGPGNSASLISAPIESPAAVTPTPAAPTPSPTPAVQPTSISVFYNTTPIDPSTGFTHIIGTPLQLTATAYPLDANLTITWASSDESVFTVDQTGLVTGVSEGSATLIVSCGDLSAEFPVWIRESW